MLEILFKIPCAISILEKSSVIIGFFIGFFIDLYFLKWFSVVIRLLKGFSRAGGAIT